MVAFSLSVSAFAAPASACAGPSSLHALTPGGAPVTRRQRGDAEVVAVDGVPTDVAWPVYDPLGYALPDGRTLVYDRYAEQSWVWDPVRRRLAPLRHGEDEVEIDVVGSQVLLVSATPTGLVSWLDLAPGRADADVLWTPAGHGELVGVSGGVPVALDHHDGRTDLVCLAGTGAVSSRPVPVPDGLWVSGRDAICGRALLLAEPLPPDPPAPTASVTVWRLDLGSGERVRVGPALVGVTNSTAVPHRRIDVRWGTPSPAQPTLIEIPITWVDPDLWCL